MRWCTDAVRYTLGVGAASRCAESRKHAAPPSWEGAASPAAIYSSLAEDLLRHSANFTPELTADPAGLTIPLMAQRIVTELTDDTNGKPADETVTFGLDGRDFEIDLTSKNATALRKALDPTYSTAGGWGTAGSQRWCCWRFLADLLAQRARSTPRLFGSGPVRTATRYPVAAVSPPTSQRRTELLTERCPTRAR